MAWFSRITRFGDVHLVFGQEANMSCGIASVLMCVFKINKFSIGKDAVKKNTEVYDAYSRISGGRYKPETQGTHPDHLALVLNELNCGSWKGGYVSAQEVSRVIDRNVGASGGIGPVATVNPVIAGVGWQGGGGHAIVVDTVRKWNGKSYATVCDPWDSNVHITPFDASKPFSYEAGKGGFSVDFSGTHKGQTQPYPSAAKGGGIAVVYRN